MSRFVYIEIPQELDFWCAHGEGYGLLNASVAIHNHKMIYNGLDLLAKDQGLRVFNRTWQEGRLYLV
jgi:hypothetical protein